MYSGLEHAVNMSLYKCCILLSVNNFDHHRRDYVTQPGKKDKERGLMEPRLEDRWDSMEKEERRTQQQ